MSMERGTPTRVPYPDHPDRCQAMMMNKGEQCHFLVEPGSKFCVLHGVIDPAKKELNVYKIRKFERRLTEFKTANGVRTLDEELAILRMTLEEVVNRCETPMDLTLYSNKITTIINNIKDLVIAADKLATKAGMLIGRSEAIVIAGKTVEIISKYVDEQSVLAKIADEIADVFIGKD